MCVELLLFRGALGCFSQKRLPPEPWPTGHNVREVCRQNGPAAIVRDESIALMQIGLRKAA